MNYKRLIILGFLGLIITTYQNCSDIAFQTADVNDQRFLLGDDLEVDLPEVDGEEPGIGDDINRDDEREYEREYEKGLARCFPRGRLFKHFSKDLNGLDLTIENKKGMRLFKNINNLVIRDSKGYGGFYNVSNVTEISRIKGAVKIQTNSVESLESIRGISCIETGTVRTVSNHKGVQLIVNPNSEVLGEVYSHDNSKGVLYLENMVLKQLSNFRGVVKLKNSTIENIENVNAIIVDLNTGRKDRVRIGDR